MSPAPKWHCLYGKTTCMLRFLLLCCQVDVETGNTADAGRSLDIAGSRSSGNKMKFAANVFSMSYEGGSVWVSLGACAMFSLTGGACVSRRSVVNGEFLLSNVISACSADWCRRAVVVSLQIMS